VSSSENFSGVVTAWLIAERAVESAVLFGSGARTDGEVAVADRWSDLDLHIVTTAGARLEHVDWPRAVPGRSFCFQVVRPATGGVRKVTAMFAAGQIDLVLVPAAQMRLARLALRCGLQRRWRSVAVALNEMATCLATGYRFLKGEKKWGGFYARVAEEMPGVRLSDEEVRNLADVFLCDLLWVLQKIDRGELAAAQHALHRSLAETNFRLLRERRQRRGLPLPSFGLARRVETMLPPDELAWVRVDARSECADLRRAAWAALAGLKALMGQLAPEWRVQPGVDELLAHHGGRPG